MIEYLREHPELVATLAVAVLVHVRAMMPPAAPGTAYALALAVWDVLAGNYGAARNKET